MVVVDSRCAAAGNSAGAGWAAQADHEARMLPDAADYGRTEVELEVCYGPRTGSAAAVAVVGSIAAVLHKVLLEDALADVSWAQDQDLQKAGAEVEDTDCYTLHCSL